MECQSNLLLSSEYCSLTFVHSSATMILEKRGDTVKEEKIRISKPPEERKQEIMDAAMRAFTEKGYEQTTMRDIAAVIGVVPGLCYRYFNSKQELFDSAVSQNVLDYCAPIVQALKRYRGDIRHNSPYGDIPNYWTALRTYSWTATAKRNTMNFSIRLIIKPSTACCFCPTVNIYFLM